MAVTNTAMYPQSIKNAAITLVNGTGTTVTNLYTAGTNGSKIESILVTSTDTASRDLGIYFTISATTYLIGTVNIPITAGFINSVPTVNLLYSSNLLTLSKDPNGNSYLYLASGTSLQIGALVAVTAAKQIQIVMQGGDY